MKIDQQLSKILTTCKTRAFHLIKNQVRLNFCILIHRNGDLVYVDPYTLLKNAQRKLKSYSPDMKVQDFCDYQLLAGPYTDYVNVNFQSYIRINGKGFPNAFVVGGNGKTKKKFGYYIFPYWTEDDSVAIGEPEKINYSYRGYVSNNQLLTSLSEYNFN